MKKKEDKIDKLARMVADGFSNVGTRIDTIESKIGSMESRMATKDDLANLCNEIDIMLDRHIGTFRRHYEELAARVKKIEEYIFPRKGGLSSERK